ncbi:MAG: ATP-binding protein [Bacteroidota bacterium]
MTISLNVLNHLGINLYSNVPAVLSEIVANAWDADAEEVRIDINREDDCITIYDNGDGMTRDEINARYLHVGYRRRDDPDRTPYTDGLKRHVMGRKGIGKLSVFSIADYVEVHSVRNDEKSGFIMKADDIKRYIEEQAKKPSEEVEYRPDPVDTESIGIMKGTKLILRELKKGLKTTAAFSRKRIARRFSVIGPENKFKVVINGEEVTVKDRDFFAKLEFVWYFGDDSRHYADWATKAREKTKFENTIPYGEGEKRYKIKGWIGTFDEHANVDEAEENNNIVLLAHGKLIKEDVLRDIKEGRIFSKYLIGEIEANFLDADDKDDIVTSDRQRIVEVDERWPVVREFIRRAIKSIGNSWTEMRENVAVIRARENPAVNEWFEQLKGDNRKTAERLFAKIETLKVNDFESKKELYRSSILAFEKLALKQTLSVLNQVDTEKEIELLKKVLGEIDELEATHYYYITRGRLDVIEKFIELTPISQENMIRDYLFEHLWLLHPSWERAASNEHVEEVVMKDLKRVSLTKEESSGRIDIRYKTAAGKNVIIELKKYDVTVNIFDLAKQLSKYRDAVKKCLRENFPDEPQAIEIIAILGGPPSPKSNDDDNRAILNRIDARYITYDQLMADAKRSYQEYLDRQKEISRIIAITDRI